MMPTRRGLHTGGSKKHRELTMLAVVHAMKSLPVSRLNISFEEDVPLTFSFDDLETRMRGRFILRPDIIIEPTPNKEKEYGDPRDRVWKGIYESRYIAVEVETDPRNLLGNEFKLKCLRTMRDGNPFRYAYVLVIDEEGELRMSDKWQETFDEVWVLENKKEPVVRRSKRRTDNE